MLRGQLAYRLIHRTQNPQCGELEVSLSCTSVAELFSLMHTGLSPRVKAQV